ncbi:MAG TPA: mannosyltransferase family protein [Acidimicrobiales bacterium]|nr:mannosyltransferase family protein [Acidimicrobiales bacterium]
MAHADLPAHAQAPIGQLAVPEAVDLSRRGVRARRNPGLALAGAGLALLWSAAAICFVAATLEVLHTRGGLGVGLRNVLLSWDSNFNLGIAGSGYHWDPAIQGAQNPAFFPAYPLLVRFAHLAGVPWLPAAVGVSVACQVGAAALLARSLALDGERASRVLAAVGLFLAFPAGVYAVLGYSTSLTVLCALGAVVACRRGRLWLAALVAGAGTAVSDLGLAVSGALVLSELAAVGWRGALDRRRLGRLALSLWGVVAFSAFLWVRFGDPIAWYTAIRGWLPTVPPWTVVGRVVTLAPVRATFVGVIGHPTEKWLMFTQDAAFVLVFAGVLLWAAARGVGFGPALALGALSFLAVNVQGARYGPEYSAIRLLYPAAAVLLTDERLRRLVTGRAAPVLLALLAAWSGVWLVLLAHGMWVE